MGDGRGSRAHKGQPSGGERALIRWIQKHNLRVAYALSDYLWHRQKWINENLDAFIESFSPDVVVSFVKSAPQYVLTVRHLREKHHIPLFSWIADDEYTALMKQKDEAKIEALRYMLRESAMICGCSEEICEYYGSVFGCEAEPLYKGCDLSTPVKDGVGSPIRIVYAGNLLYGRMDIIRRIAALLEGHDALRGRVCFDVYSNTPLSEDERRYFQERTATRYLGRQAYDVIKERLAEADIVLHAESFDPEQMVKTQYSFSTKIMDGLQSGSILLAIGPGGLSSIEYVKRIPGAVVIDDLEKVDEALLAFRNTASFGPGLRSASLPTVITIRPIGRVR